MTKSLLIVTLILHACNANDYNTKTKQDTISNVEKEQSKIDIDIIPKSDTMGSDFLSFWKEFTDVAKSKNEKAFKVMLFDSVECDGKTIHSNAFIKYKFSKVFNDSLFKAVYDRTKLNFINSEIDPSYLPLPILSQLKKGMCIERIVNITTDDKYPPIIIMLTFIETKNGYKLYKYDRIG